MNRKQRRSQGGEQRVKTYTLTGERLEALVKQGAEEQLNLYKTQISHHIVSCMLAATAVVLRDDFQFGLGERGRLRKAIDRINNQFECIAKDLVNFNELIYICNEEYGLEIKYSELAEPLKLEEGESHNVERQD